MKKLLAILMFIASITNTYSQDVKVNQGTLNLDGCFWALYKNIKDSVTINSFQRRNMFLGLTANLTKWSSLRIYADVGDNSGNPAYDLYASIKPIPELTFVFGQFKLPLGIEVLTKPENLELIEYSLIGRPSVRTLKGTRDIGIQTSYKNPFIEATAAVVNGEGRNILQDSDNNKNVAGRLIIKPLGKTMFNFGGNIYLGNYVSNNFSRMGLELNYTFSPVILKSEMLLTKDGILKGNGYYLQIGYNWRWLQPMIRFSTYNKNQSPLNEYVIGLNFRPLKDNIKVMINYKNEKITSTIRQKGILAQLQLAF
ncbi:MAG: porin [candidate division WOR-3 bacterium]